MEGRNMTDKTAFTPKEWGQILASPMLAGMAVTLADPGGLFGTLKEGMAAPAALLQARKDGSGNVLARTIADEFVTAEGREAGRAAVKATLTARTPSEVKQQALDALRNVNTLIGRKAPDEAETFRSWLQSVAGKAAEASTEGGFLGIGGVQVSAAEKATLAEIRSVLS
jgi:hypothetical protein